VACGFDISGPVWVETSKGEETEALEGSFLHFGGIPVRGVVAKLFIGDIFDMDSFRLG
jgi:hypothetical protein